MTEIQHHTPSDVWSNWLLRLRHGGDAAFDREMRAELESYADRVIDNAYLEPGVTLADIGTGEGLIAFRAIDRVGPSLRVILADVSAPMLSHAMAVADQRGVREQCTFVECGADDLRPIPDASVDVVTTRAALAYVSDKYAALREFRRILKPGGRLSLAEPVFQDEALAACSLKMRLDRTDSNDRDRIGLLMHRWKSAQYPDTREKMAASPIANYSERTLFEMARIAGFMRVHVELHIDMVPSKSVPWEVFIGASPHPWAPPLSDILAQQFTPEERQFFEETLRPSVESGQGADITKVVYLSATNA
jgi:arsenite methyltransferase